MRNYRCKCGESIAIGSMPPPPCDSCQKCKSNLATSPSGHQDPRPHNFQPTKVETDEGDKTLSRCTWCGRTKKEIEVECF